MLTRKVSEIPDAKSSTVIGDIDLTSHLCPNLSQTCRGDRTRDRADGLTDDEDEEEYEKKVMSIAHKELCIGCTACSRICPKKCYTHDAAAQ